jgi:glycosyltransferase involved in cell wall biosynthesis
MNILVLSWRDHKHPQAGGAEQVIREHIKGWIKNGHKVTLFSSRFIGSRKYENSEGIEIFHSGDQYIGVKVNAFRFWLKNHKKFDLVVDQFHGIPFFTPLYIPKPKLAVLQELAKEVWFLNGFLFPINYLIGIIGYIVEPFIFLLYRKVPFMVGSQSARKDLENVGIRNKNITVVPHGVIVKRIKSLPLKEKNKTIIFLGALTKDKGIEDALVAFSLLSKMGRYNFWIVGKGGKDYENYLARRAEELGIGNAAKFWGFVSENDKFDLLARAHVLVNPSVREGWGLVNIEANSFGVPVVAYKSAGLIDSVRDGSSGLILKNNSPKDLAAAVYKILTDDKLYDSLSVGAISWGREFSWEKSRKISVSLVNRIFRSAA